MGYKCLLSIDWSFRVSFLISYIAKGRPLILRA